MTRSNGSLTPVRVLQVITDTDRRGAQIFALDLEAALRARGFTVATVALVPGSRSAELEVRSLGGGRLAVPTLSALRKEVRRSSVVLAHGSTTLPACSIATVGTGVPFVYRQISDSLFWAPSWHRRARVRAGLQRADAVVALWSGSARVLQERFAVPSDKITVVPNGVPVARLAAVTGDRGNGDRGNGGRRHGVPNERTVLLYVGALVPEKGVDTAVEACGLMPDTHLIVAGDGPERANLEALAAAVAPGRVRFLGSVEAPGELYATADVVVLPSRGGDSMPAVLIEAGMLGVPAVSTEVQAIPEVVLDGVTGRIVRAGSPEALVEGVRDAVLHRASYGAAARQHCLERYEIGVIGEAWDRVIRDALGRR